MKRGNPEWHTEYGLHSGYPQCCIDSFLEGNGGGPCEACVEGGNDPIIHICREDRPECLPFLSDYVGSVTSFLNGTLVMADQRTKPGDFTIFTARASLETGPAFQLLYDAGFVLSHACRQEGFAKWQHTSHKTFGKLDRRHYVFQRPERGQSECRICNEKFSPTSASPNDMRFKKWL